MIRRVAGAQAMDSGPAVIAMIQFNTIYKDRKGQEISCFETDGSLLQIRLRGLLFTGRSFDYLEPAAEELEAAKRLFDLNADDELTGCEMEVFIPVKLKHAAQLTDTSLHLLIKLEATKFPVVKKFLIPVNGNTIDIAEEEERPMFFESLLIHLQKQMPADYKIQACLFCAFSHYSVYGSDNYGTLICYKELQDKILSVTNKNDFVTLTDNGGDDVQETFYCPTFTEITPGLWLYKDTV